MKGERTRLKNAFVVLHGHFYQPPRENPWLGVIEREESASPFHDWNERIAFECYRPNAYARIVDGQGKILDLFNNYSFLSFNFGPTLLNWIERERPLIYKKIIEADRESLRRLGHGNAIAQVYDHLILPLANERDQETEVRWGIAEFERHFHRKPEAMWLPETAVNYDTLRVLVQHGMRYLILSPYQALRVRPFGGKKWTDVSQGKIDTTRPYRCFLKEESGKKRPDEYIDLFFYDGLISKEIAFGEILTDGDRFCKRFVHAHQPSKKGPQLIHASTDGETYGHHKKFGEMALAYALSQGLPSRGFEILNYGAFLKRFPPIEEVEIDEGPHGEGSAWSCSHGLGRWKEDCGCSTGGKPGWNQKWRKPLREALNQLRDDLAMLFEREGTKIFQNPWEARNGYIEVTMHRSPEKIDLFFERYGRPDLNGKGRIEGLKLLEMQRHALRMFTSCGWFFADLAGLETQLILQHAARAIHYAEEFSGGEIEERFLEVLSQARSNDPSLGNGRQIYQRWIKPKRVTLEQVVNHYALSSLFEDGPRARKLFSFQVETIDQERLEGKDRSLLLGKVRVLPEIIPEPRAFLFGLIYSKNTFVQNWIAEDRGGVDFEALKMRGKEGFAEGEGELKEVLTSLLGKRIFTIHDLFRENREEIFRQLIQKEIGDLSEVYEGIFNKAEPVIELIAREGMEIPHEIRMAAEISLSHRLLQEIRALKKDFASTLHRRKIDQIVDDATRYGCHLHRAESLTLLNGLLRERVDLLRKEKDSELLAQEACIQEIIALLDSSKKWGFDLDLWEAQDLIGEILIETIKTLEESLWGTGIPKPFSRLLITLADKLHFNIEKISKAAGLHKSS